MNRLLVAVLLVLPAVAAADNQCHTIALDFQPMSTDENTDPQIVAWLETADGTFIQTVFITQQTGTFGLGNRPGEWDFNSGPLWPYGRRIAVAPVWAERHGTTYPEVDFQNSRDSDLSHPFNQSSPEVHYCRPLMPGEAAWDAMTCATPAFTDKGIFGANTSKYPPRADVARNASTDSSSVDMYKTLNGLDAVSAATPHAGTPARITWPIPSALPPGQYVLWFETSLMNDFNGTYNATTFPPPQVAFGDYGQPYRGQPSIVYQVPFTVANTLTVSSTDTYAGYGDPQGLDGAVRPPDSTITTGTDGTGAGRLALLPADSSGPAYRLRVSAAPQSDNIAPGMPSSFSTPDLEERTATVAFTAPGDDGSIGTVTGYDVRYVVGTALDASSFDSANAVNVSLSLVAAGQQQSVMLMGLLPSTTYTVGVRAYDDCHNDGPLATYSFTTLDRISGEVDACFIATAAYGSKLANDVELLRHVRDSLLQRSALGELFVETYYTFGPAVAGSIGESDLLRATARDALGPLVRRVRTLRF
ncbi:MAG TPA: fibronectin type III domain-containing protein [Kofleriaceae bacterium]|jgi:hypothetical protein